MMKMKLTLGPWEILNGQSLFSAMMGLAAKSIENDANDPLPTAREVGAAILAEALDETEKENAAAAIEEGKKRTRRTKAQIEADALAASNAAQATQPSGIALVAGAAIPARDTSMDTGAVSRAELDAEVAKVKDATKPVTKELIAQASLEFTTENPDRKPEFMTMRDTFGIKKLPELKPEQYDAFYAKLQDLISGKTTAPAAADTFEL